MVKFDGATLLRAGAGLLTAFLIGLIGWAFGAGQFTPEFEVISTLVWGKQVIGDLYAGFLLTAVFIVLIESGIGSDRCSGRPRYLCSAMSGRRFG